MLHAFPSQCSMSVAPLPYTAALKLSPTAQTPPGRQPRARAYTGRTQATWLLIASVAIGDASSPDEGSNGYGSDLRLGGNCIREVDHFR